jgi:mono/diheme cytochrome c family protein
MHRSIILSAALAALSLTGAAQAQTPAPAPAATQPAVVGNAAHGKMLMATTGCYQCHGYQGQGLGTTGPRLAPPSAFEPFIRQLRKPRDTMPLYTAKVMPESDVRDIYAYLQSIPKAKAVADIPLLNH